MDISTIGIDLAKSVFQLHGVDAEGRVVLEKKVRRAAFLAALGKLPPCVVGMEACATVICANFLSSVRHLSCAARGIASGTPRRGCMTCLSANRPGSSRLLSPTTAWALLKREEVYHSPSPA